MVLTCSNGTLTNVLPHMNVMLQTQDMTPNPVTVYRHTADLLSYPLMWNVTLEIQLPILMSWVRPDWEILPRSLVESTIPTGSVNLFVDEMFDVEGYLLYCNTSTSW